MADPTSFRNAVYLAVDIFNRRKEYEEIPKNQVQEQEIETSTPKEKEEDGSTE